MKLVKFQNPIPSIIDQFINHDFFDWNDHPFLSNRPSMPSVNIKEDKDAYYLDVMLPGFVKSDINLEITDDVLSISSEKQSDNTIKDGDVISRQEYTYRSFVRSFKLPHLIKEDKIEANFKNGILTITIPKMEEAKAKPIKQIEIK